MYMPFVLFLFLFLLSIVVYHDFFCIFILVLLLFIFIYLFLSKSTIREYFCDKKGHLCTIQSLTEKTPKGGIIPSCIVAKTFPAVTAHPHHSKLSNPQTCVIHSLLCHSSELLRQGRERETMWEEVWTVWEFLSNILATKQDGTMPSLRSFSLKLQEVDKWPTPISRAFLSFGENCTVCSNLLKFLSYIGGILGKNN